MKAAFEPWEAIGSGRPHDAALKTLSVDLLMAAGVEGADLVHTHTWYANFAGHLARLLYDIPHVVTTHSLEPRRPWKAEQLGGGYAVSSFCERTALEAADAVIAVSGAMRDDVLDCYPGVDPDRVVVIHNGVDTEEFTPDRDTDALPPLGIDPDRPYVTFVGRITRQKGIDLLLDAAERFDPDTQLVLLPSAPDTPEVGEEMRARAAGPGRAALGSPVARAGPPPSRAHPGAVELGRGHLPVGLRAVRSGQRGGHGLRHGGGGHRRGRDPRDRRRRGDRHARPSRARPTAGPPTRSGSWPTSPRRSTPSWPIPPPPNGWALVGRKRAVEEFSWPAIAQRTVELYRSLTRSP